MTRLTWAVLACTVAAGICVEEAARIGLERVSSIHRRILNERRQAGELRRTTPLRTMLLTGNSLLLDDVDMDMFTAGVGSRYRPQRYAIEQTSYIDWEYGLRRLFRHGMRADVIVLCLNPPQLASNGIRGDFSARTLFDLQDIWPAARASGADLTRTSGYYLAHFSAFYSERAELRSVLMFRFARPVVDMWHQAVTVEAVIPTDKELIPVLEPRLKKLRELCAEYGAEFEFLVPPTAQSGDVATLQAGEAAGVKVLRPVPNFSLSKDSYLPDGFHLNAAGATAFTKALIGEVMQ